MNFRISQRYVFMGYFSKDGSFLTGMEKTETIRRFAKKNYRITKLISTQDTGI